MESVILQNAHTIEQVAEVITEGTSFHTSEELAAQYAIDAIKTGDFPEINEQAIEAHLDFVEEAGAKFDRTKAIALALAAE